MKNIKSIIAAILLLTGISANAGEKKTEGFEYFLPKTAVRMSVLVEKTTIKPGKLAEFSELYFQKKGITTQQDNYRIVGVSFTTTGLPDQDLRFFIPSSYRT